MVKYTTKNINSILIGLSLIIASIRGFFETIVEKDDAYVLQLLLLVFPLLIVTRNKILLSIYDFRKGSLLIISISSIIIISVINTYFINGEFGSPTIFIFLFIFLLNYLIWIIINRNININLDILYSITIFNAILLIFVALLQQLNLNFIDMPGGTTPFEFIRPQSLTGSFLHYPLIISISSLIFLDKYLKCKKLIFCVAYFISFAAVIFSLSRSGMFITILGSLLLYFSNFRILIRNKVLNFLIIFSCIIIYNTEPIYDRLINATNIDSTGNDTRVSIWFGVLNKLQFSDLFIGSYFGLVSNSYRGNFDFGYSVPESSVLLLILNIGFIGCILTYIFFGSNYTSLKSKNAISCYIALITSTFFYQSIEVIPFIVFFTLFPIYLNEKNE
ncbi:O-antigen ligase [Polynucleobacter sp. AP-Reno-20A-A9]|uniref:O-antigen ligase family protein n=1 Tax=Polynucleobacter sp. AP-Reno-20A-A9 TaxID=2576925 RepID=UPI001C0E11B0|nr:hypothetical protein [Polynucleobacter sp. AP-Reno-20A-A9]MBU3629313.1 hypothetical protein [Polynucleobacter sp. AP-Reno-20A-A9]